MMKSVLIKVPFSPNEDMVEEPAYMLTELQNVEYFHGCICLIESVDISSYVSTIAITTQPGRHKACSSQNDVSS
jgi:hypothetical protein